MAKMTRNELEEKYRAITKRDPEGKKSKELAEEIKAELNKMDKKIKVHGTLGKYIKVKVIALRELERKGNIYVGVNTYSNQIPQRKETWIPEKVAEFLEKSTYPVHEYDEDFVTANGNKGGHTTKLESAYEVIRL